MNLSLEGSLQVILKDGFFVQQDSCVGANIDKMNQENVPLASVHGWDFFKINVFDNLHIRLILESFFERPILGLYRSIGPTLGDYTFWSDPNELKAEILLVQLWTKESKVTYWVGSHKYWLDTVVAENSLLRVPRARIDELELKSMTVDFKSGGFALLDSRTAFEVSQGTGITFAFGTEEKVKHWNPMRLPKSREIQDKIAQMENGRFGINVAYMKEYGEIDR